MIRRAAISSLAAWLAAMLASGAAVAAAPAAPPLVLEKWIQAALPGHADVRQADLELLRRARLERAASVWEDPELRLGRESREDRGDQTDVRLRLPLPNPWALGSGRALAGARQALARSGRTAALVKAHAELKELYLEAAYRQEDERLLRALADQLGVELGRADAQWEARRITADQRLRIAASAAEARIRAALATHRAAALAAEMAALSGLPAERVANLDTAVLDPAALLDPLPPPEELRRAALAHSPLLERQAILRQLETLAATDARRRLLPAPEFVQGTWTRDAGAGRDDWGVQIQFSLPVFSWFRERALANARAGHLESVELLQQDLVARALTRAHLQAAAASTLLLAVEAEARPLDEDIAALLADPDAGLPLDRMRLLDARTRALRDWLEARHTLARRLLDLEALVGIHDPDPILEQLSR